MTTAREPASPPGTDDAVHEVVADLLARLEVAHGELRASHEEVRSHQARISELAADGVSSRSELERVAELLPVLAVTTDDVGLVLSANATSSRLLGVPVDTLVGRPLVSVVLEAGRALVGAAMVAAAVGTQQVRVPVAPRHGPPVDLDVTVTRHDAHDVPVLFWFAVPRATDAAAAGAMDAALASALADLAAIPVVDTPLPDLLVLVARAAARSIPGVAHATVTVGDPRSPELLASDSQEAQRADAAQLDAGEGPCVDTWVTGQVTTTADATADPRWPRLGRYAAEAALRGVIGVPVPRRGGTTTGVLNLYLAADGDLADALPHLAARAETFAAAAGAVLLDARRIQELRDEAGQLRTALGSRSEIDQAKGIVMARMGCDADEAFAHLVSVSRDNNVKLREVARRLVDSVRRPAS